MLRGVPSNRCLDVPGSSQANGTQVTIYDCNGGANQQWKTT
ncbi:RICIN domain-containing protein [Microbispora sitophila]|nr:RICIN domain-containing protein [Microbispora sitophila]